MLSFNPRSPCGGYFGADSCSISNTEYEAFFAPFLSDLVWLFFFFYLKDPTASVNSSISYGWNNDRFVVLWEDIPLYGNSLDPVSFQLVLNRDGSAQFIYRHVDFALSE